MEKVGIGIVGCGNISGAYLTAMRGFPILDIRGVADLNADLARARAAEFAVPVQDLDALFADPNVQIIVNLTVPKAHVAVGLRALEAGKHTYSEKPLGITFAEGSRLARAAAAKGLRIGAAPDTFLGGGQQTVRAIVDAGEIGAPVGGTANFMNPGHESWHPNPDFYYEPGGGPMLDMGPYYITALVNLLGPVAEVAGFAAMPRATRTITSQPRSGQTIPVHVATHVAGTLRFATGALVQVAMSFDVPGHKHPPIELYGTEGAIQVPDPNRFGGPVEVLRTGGAWQERPIDLPYADGNFRSLGVADMAHALRSDRPHRASGDLALHVLEVMEAFQTASDQRRVVAITTLTDRPAPLAQSVDRGQLAR
ncbi:gfo/Idh/MocA family oxidoreductase [bacterium]|nr:gfo/Idh/MocA family oxidoreductase [bacterium]